MRVTTLLLTITLAVGIFGAPAVGDSGVSTSTTQELAERNICFEVLGFNFGGPCYGSWGKGHYVRYKDQCGNLGWDVGARIAVGGGLAFRWGGHWINEADWSLHGDYWLPVDVNLWGTMGPAPWQQHHGVATPHCFQKYRDACHARGFKPHYYWDSAKNGYFYFFDNAFHFEADFAFTADGKFWVPRTCGCFPGPSSTHSRRLGPGPHRRA